MTRDQPRVVAIVQARLGSVRLPRKVLHPILGQPALEVLVARLARARRVSEVVLAIPDTPPNDELAQFAAARDLRCFRGSEWDVLDRYLGAAEAGQVDRPQPGRAAGGAPGHRRGRLARLHHRAGRARPALDAAAGAGVAAPAHSGAVALAKNDGIAAVCVAGGTGRNKCCWRMMT